MVYLIVNEKECVCKIGYSQDPAARLVSLQTGCPYPLTLAGVIEGDIELERSIHKEFEYYRLEGEWFHLCRDIKDRFGVISSQHIKLYPEGLQYTKSLTDSQFRILIALSLYIEPKTNEIILNKRRREELIAQTGLKRSTINTGISQLSKKNLLVKICNGAYQMNPKIFFNGDELQRSKYLEVIYRYEICPECK